MRRRTIISVESRGMPLSSNRDTSKRKPPFFNTFQASLHSLVLWRVGIRSRALATFDHVWPGCCTYHEGVPMNSDLNM